MKTPIKAVKHTSYFKKPRNLGPLENNTGRDELTSSTTDMGMFPNIKETYGQNNKLCESFLGSKCE